MSTLSAGSAPEQVPVRQFLPSVGEEFITWAEECWNIKRNFAINNPDTFAGEKCDYEYMKKIFIKKINSLIEERIEEAFNGPSNMSSGPL